MALGEGSGYGSSGGRLRAWFWFTRGGGLAWDRCGRRARPEYSQREMHTQRGSRRQKREQWGRLAASQKETISEEPWFRKRGPGRVRGRRRRAPARRGERAKPRGGARRPTPCGFRSR